MKNEELLMKKKVKPERVMKKPIPGIEASNLLRDMVSSCTFPGRTLRKTAFLDVTRKKD
jgi:hypothetical protein